MDCITADECPSISAPLRIVASPNPFSDWVVDVECPAGGTILDLINISGCDRALLGGAHVYVTDRAMTREPIRIERKNWHRVRPKPGMHVSIRVVATPGQSGGSGSKNPLRTILTIAVIAASFVVPQMAIFKFGNLGNLGGLLSKDLFVGQILAGIGTSLVGNAIVNAVAPVQSANLSQVSGQLYGESTSATLTITGSQNRIQAGAPVVSIAGETRLYPMMRNDAPPYTESEGTDQYLRQLFDLGYGPVELAEERIGTVPLSGYDGIEDEFLAGYDDDAVPTLYANTIRQDGYSVLLAADVPRSFVSRPSANELSGDFSFQGLTTFDSSGNPGSRTVEVKIEYRLAGSGDPLTLHGTETITAATTSLYTHPFRIVLPEPGEYEVVTTRLTADSGSTQVRDECFVTALRSITYTPPEIPKGRAVKTMRAKATHQLNGVIDSYNCIARRLYPIWDGESWSDPVFTRNPAWVSLGILRLGRKGNAKPMPDSRIDLPTWLAFSQWCDRLDQNDEPMFQVGGVIDTRRTVKETIDLILSTARAWLDNIDGKWSVGWDQPQTTAVQMFTPRNSWNFQYERNFVDLPHALKGKFINPENDYQQDEVIIYRDGFDSSTATEIEALEYLLVDRASQVWRDLEYRWGEALLRPATYKLDCDMEHFQVRRGKKVRVSNRIMRWGLGEGRIKALTLDEDDNVTGLVLDETLTLEAGKSYGLRIRKADSTQIQATPVTPAESTETRMLTLSPAIAAAQAPAVGDLCAFGIATGYVTVPLIVHSIERLGGMNARLEMVDEAPELHEIDQGELPTFDPHQTFQGQLAIGRPPAPTIVNVVSDHRAMVPIPGGGWHQYIHVDLNWGADLAVPVQSVISQYRRVDSGDAWQRTTFPPTVTAMDLGPVQEGLTYAIEIWAISGGSRPGAASAVAVYEETVIGKEALPSDVANFNVWQNGVQVDMGWDLIADPDRNGYLIKRWRTGAGSFDTGIVVKKEERGTAISTATIPPGDWTFGIKAIDTSQNLSANAATARIVVASVNQQVGTGRADPGWRGTLSGFRRHWTGVLVPESSKVANEHTNAELFEQFVPYPVAESTAELPDVIDFGANVAARVYGDVRGRLGRGVTGETFSAAMDIDYRKAEDAFDGFEPWESGDVNARYVNGRCRMTGVRAVIEAFSVTADAAVEEQEGTAAVDAGGSTVAFAEPFLTEPTVEVFLAEASAKIATYDPASVTTAGFTAHVFDTNGADPGGPIRYKAKGIPAS